MAGLLFKKSCIKVEKAFFGLKTNVIYTPTNSAVVGEIMDYDCANGKKVLEFYDANPNQIELLIKKEGRPETGCNGNTRLFLCYSKDHQFMAMQVFQYSNFEYHAAGEAKFFEGMNAVMELKAFVD